MTYYPRFVNTSSAFATLTFPSWCGLFPTVTTAQLQQVYLFDALQFNFYGAYDDISEIQFNIPQPRYGYADFVAGPPRALTVFANGSTIHRFTATTGANRHLLEERKLMQLDSGAQCIGQDDCHTFCKYLSQAGGPLCAIVAAEACGLAAAFCGIAAGAVCNKFVVPQFQSLCDTSCSSMQCVSLCSNINCSPGFVGACGDFFCDYCECQKSS